MIFSRKVVSIATTLAVAMIPSSAYGQQIPTNSNSTKIATSAFGGTEPSGIDYIPSNDMLVTASDEGSIVFVKRSDPNVWYRISGPGGKQNWEGLTIDTGDSSNHFYVIHEGKRDDNDSSILKKYEYTLNNQGGTDNGNSITLNSTATLTKMDPYLTGSHGIESLTLYKPSSATQRYPEFIFGVQKTGLIYVVSGDPDQPNDPILVLSSPTLACECVSGSQYLAEVSV